MYPLEGVLVVAIEQAVAAPTCTVRLADAGARVIKIERAGGETARHYDRAVHGTSAYFAWLNRGKESAVLDIKDAGDRALVEAMAAKADVFVQNLAPGAAQRLGLAASQLVERYPRLIALDIVGYRQDSECADMRAYDMLVQAESGICAVTGTPEEAAKVGVSMADIATGMNAHAAILEALLARNLTGRGQALQIAMFDAMADMMSVPLLHLEHEGRDTPRTGLSHASIYPYGSFSCIDGQIVIVVQNPGEWRRLCTGVLGLPDLVDDPRFSDNPCRVENREQLAAIIAAVFASLTRSQAISLLEANALAWSNVSTVADLSRHPALQRIDLEVPGGTFQCAGSPLRREVRGTRVPGLGEHTHAIRKEFSS